MAKISKAKDRNGKTIKLGDLVRDIRYNITYRIYRDKYDGTSFLGQEVGKSKTRWLNTLNFRYIEKVEN